MLLTLKWSFDLSKQQNSEIPLGVQSWPGMGQQRDIGSQYPAGLSLKARMDIFSLPGSVRI